MKNKLKKIWKWLRQNIFNKRMIVPFIIAETIFWIPVIVGLILGLVISPWWHSMAVAYIAFWGGPFTPAMPLQFALMVLIRKIIDKIK